MSKKKILIFISVILIIFGGVYLKMKYDEKAKQKEIYYKEQQERITLYLKYNTKKPNTIKSVHFTSLKQGPMVTLLLKAISITIKKMILMHLRHLKTIINLEVDLQQTLKYLNYLNRLMNLNHPMKSKKI